MFGGIVAAFKNLFSFLSAITTYLANEQLREDGRRQAELKTLKEAYDNAQVSSVIDRQPTPRDKSSILGGLRVSNPNGYYLGAPNSVPPRNP